MYNKKNDFNPKYENLFTFLFNLISLCFSTQFNVNFIQTQVGKVNHCVG